MDFSRCNKSFVRKSDYTLHMNRNHSENRPFPCPFPGCTHSYASRFELTRHQKVHSSYKEAYAVCLKSVYTTDSMNIVSIHFTGYVVIFLC